jgi:hypothetical protein
MRTNLTQVTFYFGFQRTIKHVTRTDLRSVTPAANFIAPKTSIISARFHREAMLSSQACFSEARTAPVDA